MKPTPVQPWRSADPYAQPVIHTHTVEKRMGFWTGLVIGAVALSIPAFFIGGCVGVAGSGLGEAGWEAEQRQKIRDEIYREFHMGQQAKERSARLRAELQKSFQP